MLATCIMPSSANDDRATLRANGLEQARGYAAHANCAPFDEAQSAYWKRGWNLREETAPRKDGQ